MKKNQISRKIILALFATLILGFLIPQTVFCQTEKLGIVQYTPPPGMTKTPKSNVVAFSEYNQTTGTYCIVTLYGATPSTGNPTGDFTRDWNKLVVASMKADANPKTDIQVAEGWTVISGGGEVESEAGKAVGFLTVISGFGKTVSILAVFNDAAYVGKVDAFIKGIDVDKDIALASNTAAANPPPVDNNGKVVIPLPTRQLTVADLEGEWSETAGFSTTYVDRNTGSYAGTDSLHYRSKMTFTRNGGYANDFFAIRNGQKIVDKTSGTVTIIGRLLSIRQKGIAKYVIRGWLELPDMTIMIVCGPWYGDDEIPERIFTTLEQGANLNANWIRKK